MKIVFCDDDMNMLQQMQEYVREYFLKNHLPPADMCAYTSGDDLVAADEAADIAFLDVEMPGESGIQVGAWLMEKNPKTMVFIVTAHPDYLDEAMRFHVFRYLSKPVNKDRLFRNLKEALYRYNLESFTVVIETQEGVLTCDADEIVCLEGVNRKTKIYTIGGEYISPVSIREWGEKLQLPCFYQTYRSYIVNMKYVFKFDKTLVHQRYGGKTLTTYLARRSYNDFKNRYLLYRESVR